MYILDSYAILCLLDGKRETEALTVQRYLEDAETSGSRLFLSRINEGEIFYRLYRYLGSEVARGFREDIKKGLFPIELVSVNDRRVERASEIKAQFRVSYADAFCIELALEMKKPVLTGDPEFECVKDLIEIVKL